MKALTGWMLTLCISAMLLAQADSSQTVHREADRAEQTGTSQKPNQPQGLPPATPRSVSADGRTANGSVPGSADVADGNMVVITHGNEHKKDCDSGGIGSWIRLLIPWPALILLALLYVLVGSSDAASRIETLLGPFQSLKLFGQEFVLNPQGGRTAEAAIMLYRRRVQQKFDRQMRKLKLREKHEKVVNDYVKPRIDNFDQIKFRSTIQVPDLLFGDGLYQLLDYFPKQEEGGRGRTFSVRFGMIGRAWRLEESQYAPSVPKGRLIPEWGMTREEAERAGRGRQSFGCVLLKGAGGGRLAVFFMDSPVQEAFGTDKNDQKWKQLEAAILRGSQESELIDGLEALYADLLKASAQVQIYSQAQAKLSLSPFDMIADEYYDRLRHPTCHNFRVASEKILAAWLANVPEDARVCEVGAGSSLAAQLLEHHHKRIDRLLLTDDSARMLEYSRYWVAKGAILKVAPAEALPVESGTVDWLVSSLGDPYNSASFWEEAYRVLRGGGTVIFTTPSYEWAQAFRTGEIDPAKAEFELGDGRRVSFSSVICSEEEQRGLIESAGFVVQEVVNVTIGELPKEELSPKLCPQRGAAGKVVTGYRVSKA